MVLSTRVLMTRPIRFFEFVWLPAFEESAEGLFGDAERRALEMELLETPTKGPVIAGTGGVRKIRVALPGRGKRGAARVIYYFRGARERIYMIAVYAKGKRLALTPEDRAVIRKLVQELKREV